ncbi:MAG: ASKHA domain-containing protein [Desulfobacterales bacterium]|jgi:uncharacterized 2Fe-2S/4Fe-4S cluster protein (DUF4445 family)
MTESAWIHDVSLSPPSLEDNSADADRLMGVLKRQAGLPELAPDLSLLRRLPERLRRWGWNARCVVFPERGRWALLEVYDPSRTDPIPGLAVDIGTTRVVLRLVALDSGKTLAEAAFDNPQIEIGPDVLARIHHADRPGGLQDLHGRIIAALNREVEAICTRAGTEPEEIVLVSAAGNTTMTHLFLGLPPRWIIREPYIPAANRLPVIRAGEIGLNVHPRCRLLTFPNIGSYFGGDLIAGILHSGIHRRAETTILVDVGTNAEVVLGNENWLIACAGAAGPALEGGVTRMGMNAAPGVIDRVQVDPKTGTVELHTIEDLPPIGICGSGLIDLAAQLFLAGMVDMRGKFVASRCGSRLVDRDGIDTFLVADERTSATGKPLTLSQIDLDSLTRSKAAMYTILETLTLTVGVSFDELAAFHVAGTFGSFIRAESAIAIGMLPDIGLQRYVALGNSSLEGAARALTDASAVEELDRIRDRITYLELNVNQDFMNRFSAAKFYPHTDPKRFPSVPPPPA